MYRSSFLALLALAVVGAPADHAALAQPAEARDRGPRYEITVTNLTAAEIFTPILAASHVGGARLFDLGSPASVPLEALAEAGDVGPLVARATGSPAVRDIAVSSGPLPPGGSVTLELAAGGRFDHVSVASMLVPSNDAFFAANGVEGPRGHDTVVVLSPAYDAGTERNDQECASIPGPPNVCQGEGFNASRAGAEGFVHVHRGIHDIGDLSADTYDWRNPVARITIRLIR